MTTRSTRRAPSGPARTTGRSGADVGSGAAPAAALAAALAVPVDGHLLDLALTHRSHAYEHGGLPTNERLEFLGDSVLGVVVTERLYRRFPDVGEGTLARLRAAVVNARALAAVGRDLGVGAAVRLGRGEEITGGRDRGSILADTVEALIGAVFLSGGPEAGPDAGPAAARALVRRLFDPLIEDAAVLGAGLDWKTSLQELTAEHGLGVPDYVITDEGPDHMKTFHAKVRVADVFYGDGVGRSKKEAEQACAQTAYGEIATSLGAAGAHVG